MKLNSLKYIALCVLFVACAASNNSKPENTVQLLKADYYSFSQGIGGGRGMTYSFYIKVNNTDNDITFDSVWVDNRRIVLDESTEKDTLVCTATHTFRPEDSIQGEQTVNQNVFPPIKHNGKALLRYYVDGEPNYLTVHQFNERASKSYY